jgi:hypothetical protein
MATNKKQHSAAANEKNAPARKEKKMSVAIDIYTEMQKKHAKALNSGKMTKREFRAEVVAEMSKRLGVTNNGTLGMYYSVADFRVTGREAKKYNRVATRGPNLTPEERAQRDAQRAQIREAAKKVKEGKPLSGDLAAAAVDAAQAYDQITKLVHAQEAARVNTPATATKKAARKSSTKKSTAKKATTKKSTAKKATARKTPAKKSTAKKAA